MGSRWVRIGFELGLNLVRIGFERFELGFSFGFSFGLNWFERSKWGKWAFFPF